MELILTEAEKKANTWLELDDESVGKVVKSVALKLAQYSEETAKIALFSAAILIIGKVNDTNAETFTQTIEGLTAKGQSIGNWNLTVKKLPDKPQKEG